MDHAKITEPCHTTQRPSIHVSFRRMRMEAWAKEKTRSVEKIHFVQYAPCWNSFPLIFASLQVKQGRHAALRLELHRPSTVSHRCNRSGHPGIIMDDITLEWINACCFIQEQDPAWYAEPCSVNFYSFGAMSPELVERTVLMKTSKLLHLFLLF